MGSALPLKTYLNNGGIGTVMDLKQMIRDMIQSGMSNEEIVENLKELGIENVNDVLDETLRDEAEKAKKKVAHIVKKEPGPDDEIGDAEPEEGKPLFEEPPAMQPHEKEAAKKATEEIPELEITSVSGNQEKQTNIEEMLGKAEMKRMPHTALSNVEDVENKLDEAIALLKSVQDINQKILEANRDVLLRLKMQK